MKKTFIFILVLGISVLAGAWSGDPADLSYMVNGQFVESGQDVYVPAGPVLFQVVNTMELLWASPAAISLGIPPSRFSEMNPIVIDRDENLCGYWHIEPYGYDPEPTFYWEIINDIPSPGFHEIGPLFDVTLNMKVGDVVPLETWDANFETLTNITLIAVPEPASLTLLAAGGQLLRRSFRAG
jgi:hypothetical protein